MADHTKHRILLGTAAATAAVVAAPSVLPLFHIGPPDLTQQILKACGSTTANTGAAAAINNAISNIPHVGKFLAAGTWSSALISGGLGIGGMLLGDYVHNHYDKPGQIQWGKIIKYAALGTSLLIALPSLLSGITMGLTFLGFLASPAIARGANAVLASTLGSLSSMGTGLGGLTSLMPHILSCGVAALPVVGALAVNSHTQSKAKWADRVEAQPTHQPGMAM